MTGLLDLAARAALVLLVALAASAMLRRQSAALRHRFLAAGLAGSLIVAPLSWLTPTLITVAPASETSSAALTPIEVEEPGQSARAAAGASGARPGLWLLWIAGATARGLWLVGALVLLRRRTRQNGCPAGAWERLLPGAAAAIGVNRRVTLRAASDALAPATWGWRSPVILVPASAAAWPDLRVRLVLLHELAHVRRLDWPVQMLGEAACAVYWFNPLVWLARSRLRRESERACDDLVLGCGISAERYGTELVDVARLHAHRPYLAGTVPMARASSLEGRIVAMLDPTTASPSNHAPRAALACGALVVSLLIPIATLGVAAQADVRSFTVQVFDLTGAVLPGTSVELTDAEQERAQRDDGGIGPCRVR